MLPYADVCWQQMERIEVAVRDANTSVEAVELVVRCLDMAGHSLAHVRDAKSALVNYCLESLTLTHAGGIRADLMPRTQGTTHTQTHASGHHGPHATVDISQLFAACCLLRLSGLAEASARYSVYLLYWYYSTNTDSAAPLSPPA